MSLRFLLGRDLEFPNRDLFLQWKEMTNDEENQFMLPQEVSGMDYWNDDRRLLG
jgi:hypothetical protein